MSLPESRAGAVKCLCRWRERQIIGLLSGKLTQTIEGARRRVDFAHRFQQQILQGGVKILPYEQSVAGGKQVKVRIGNVATQANEAPPQHHMLQPGDRFGDGFRLRDIH